MAFKYENQDSVVGDDTYLNMNDEADSLTRRSTEVQKWMDRSLLPRTLYGGTYEMRRAGEDFLPKNELESPAAYKRRLAHSTLLNAYRKTSSYLSGQVFQSDVIFDDGIDEYFKDISEAIDTKGNKLDVFSKRVFQNGLAKGVAHILVDMPKRDKEVVTKQDEKEKKIRPYFREVKPESVLGCIVSESGFLLQVRIAESSSVRYGKYGTKTVEKVRVLEPGKWELFVIDGEDEKLEDSGTFSVDFIPLVTFIPGEEWSSITGETPTMDLADLNAKHWRSSSDQDNILHVARVPILFGRHIDTTTIPVGVAAMISSDDDQADLKYVEHSGAAIAAGSKDLEEIEAAMALYGLQQLVPRTGNMTATEKAITSAESNSSLGTWATEFEGVLNDCFTIAGIYVNKEFKKNGLALNKEYSFGIADPQELAVILDSYDRGIISARGAFSEFRRRGIYDEHLTWEDVEDDNEKEARDSKETAGLNGTIDGDGNLDA